MELFKILGSIVIDNQEANDELDETTEHAEDAEGKIGKAFKKIAGAVVAAFAIDKIKDWSVALGKASLDAYASYEQLVGGVDTLFKDSSSKVQNYAANAYKTAGMSANEYMETVTSFSASLIQSLSGDTNKAATVADMAIRDMSDNANKMGTAIQSIQDAYQGFAKQNYTMLDNLKLGYGGTQSEMLRLLEDAEKIKAKQGEVAEYSIDSYADIVEAIHVVQDEMGITGTTAAEAAGTIEGSVATMKAAWQNMLVGIADENQAIAPLFTQLWDSVMNVASNVVPRIGQIIMGFGDFIKIAAPQVINEAKSLFGSLSLDAVVEFSKNLLTGSQSLVKSGMNLLQDIAQGIANALPSLIAKIPIIVGNIADMINTNAPTILAGGAKIILTLAKGLISAIPTLVANIPTIIQAAVKVWMAFGWAALGRSAISGAANGIKGGANLIKKQFDAIANAAKSKWTSIKNAMLKPIESAVSKLRAAMNKIKSIFKTTVKLKLKVPKISVSGGKAPWGIGGAGSKPSFSVKWNAEGTIFKRPTIFNTAEGLQGVGDVKKGEAVAPIEKLMGFVSMAVSSQLQPILELLANQQSNVLNIALALQVDGKTIATATSKYMQDELNKQQTRALRLQGVR